MARYWVTGGKYADTSFTKLAEGEEEVRKGPFDTYEDAHAVWAAASWANVDDAFTRYRIDKEQTPVRYWVLGGRFADTRFRDLAEGAELEKYGPYDDYTQANAKWAELSWATVDDAFVRYRIVTDEGDTVDVKAGPEG